MIKMIKEKNCNKHSMTKFVHRQGENKWRCRKCSSESVIRRVKNKKTILVKMFGGKCKVCGYNKYQGALQFHHINPKEKSFGIAQKYQSYSLERLVEEANKCILVCANCHIELEHYDPIA